MLDKIISPISVVSFLIANVFNIKGPCPFHIEVSKDQVIDYSYFQKLLEFDFSTLNGDFTGSKGGFGNFIYLRLNSRDKELERLINYMKKNNYMIAPDKYLFLDENWIFHNGAFIFINNGIHYKEVFKFQKIPEENEPTDN